MSRPAASSTITIGATAVTYLPDGYGWLNPAAAFPSSQPDGWRTHSEFLDERGWFPVSIGSFLIQTSERAVLVDLGLGRVEFSIPDVADFRGGDLIEALAGRGLAPADIDTVFYTHLHHDHVGWTSNVAPAPNAPEGPEISGLTFRSARHLVSGTEWEHWSGTHELVGPDPSAVQAPLETVIGYVSDGDEIAPGVRVLATPGHTPGHSSLVVTDAAGKDPRRLVILGDVMHCQVQVVETNWSFAFDVDPAAGITTREHLLKDLEDDNTILAGGHFADNVFGRVLPAEMRRAWSSGYVAD
ncbi:MBL fold metallo-hydrolase [Nocardia sp. AB354]|uniref:MBL fold metallo-hydrolase n=1 Tax=Nocardia sp. AB354 TaxID=3413283 RepID=UPI003C1B5045